MIRQLHLKDVGPSRELNFDFAPRINILTGDNGLGKTFVLDLVWWVLTTTWAGEQAFPWRPPTTRGSMTIGDSTPLAPEISAILSCDSGDPSVDESVITGGRYQWTSQEWSRKRWELQRSSTTPKIETTSYPPDSPPHPPQTLVVYARIDGSFVVWDAYQVKDALAEAAVLLYADELWEGKEIEDRSSKRRRTVSRGVLEDWVTWQSSSSSEFAALCRVLAVLSDPEEPLVPGPPTRVRLDDRRDVPTLAMPYGVVPVTLASAGQRRVLALAYILVWAWAEHLKAAEVTRREPTRDMVVLIDEVELHLHPRWQRLLLPALRQAIAALAPGAAIQLIASTHAPLVLASLEPFFDEELDNLYRFERDGTAVDARTLLFAKQGDAADWLVSETFGLSPRSVPSEAAIHAATAFMRGDLAAAESALQKALAGMDATPAPDPRSLKDRIHAALRVLLPDHDTFWPRWIVTYERTSAPQKG
jgi:hypothetical protein